ncbi:unnamed protein product [Calicophoron daubneyi]|uniref:SOCS box domain-containing protein n=1 Tax=Calicophoron daubneyi TaxID=300641 RepID=A0AAV2TR66_CALDB
MGNKNSLDRSTCEDLLDIIEHDEPERLHAYLSASTTEDHQNMQNGPLCREPLTESTFLDENSRNLLHFAAMRSATKCAALLVSPPYNWSADKQDQMGWSPMQIAEDRDDIPTLYELSVHSRELRYYPYSFPEQAGFQLMSTCLFWPQDVIVTPFGSKEFFRTRLRGLGKYTETPAELRGYESFMDGHSIALFFELLLSNPELCDPFVLTGQPEYGVKEREDEPDHWIIKLPDRCPMEHAFECQIFPHCLLRDWIMSLAYRPNKIRAFKDLQNVWIVHRFTVPSGENYPIEYRALPPTLKEFCRMTIRRYLVRHVQPDILRIEARLFPNYGQLVRSLHLPPDLQNYLLYREMWPVYQWQYPGEWRPYKNFHNLPMMLRGFGFGFVRGHSFISWEKSPRSNPNN